MRYKFTAILAGILIMACTFAEAQQFRSVKNRVQKRIYRHGTFQFNAGAAIASYYGDLKDNPTNFWARPSIQLGAQYRVNNHWHIRSEVLWYRIAGADSLNNMETGIYTRNLSFRADNVELNVVGLWYLFNKFARYNRPTFNPYAFAGIGLTTNNPKAYYQGEWHALRPLQTEGVQYGSVIFAMPAGIGVTYHINNSWDISAEWGYRITFSDYLDDVSTYHLGIENIDDPLRRALADRGPEMGRSPRPEGSIRGNPDRNDWYLVTGLKVTYSPGAASLNRYRRAKYR